MQLIKIFVEPNANDPRKVKLSAKCPLCGRDNELVVDKREFEEGYEKYCNGALVQDSFPNWTADQREFILTGNCPCTWG